MKQPQALIGVSQALLMKKLGVKRPLKPSLCGHNSM